MNDSTAVGGKAVSHLRILMLMRDTLPPVRPDVAVLFGTALPRLGVNTDLVGVRTDAVDNGSEVWPAGVMHAMDRPADGIFGEIGKTWLDLRGLAKWLGPQHDIVQVRDKVLVAAITLLVARISRRPFVYWMSFPIVEGHAIRSRQVGFSKGLGFFLAGRIRAFTLKVLFYKIVLRYVDHIFVQSESMRDFVAEHGVSRDRMTPVPMGVDVSLFLKVLNAEKPCFSYPKRRTIVYLGALAHARESDFMLQVIRRVRVRIPDAFLLLVGDGVSADERAWIRRTIKDLDLEAHVMLTGWLPQEQALPLVASAEVGLSPIPRGELFDVSSPTKAIEYLALGVPCVGNDIPDQKLVLEQSAGGLCVPMQVDAFSTAIVTLLENLGRARAMGASGRTWVAENRSYERLAQTVAPVYHALASTRQSRLRVAVPTSTP